VTREDPIPHVRLRFAARFSFLIKFEFMRERVVVSVPRTWTCTKEEELVSTFSCYLHSRDFLGFVFGADLCGICASFSSDHREFLKCCV
jgi:hypothetical protein